MAEAGLFGPSPWEVQQAQQQSLGQGATAYAQMSPMERSASSMYQAGGLLGGILAEKFGGVNVPMRQAQDVAEIQKGIDHTTVDGLMQGAAQLKNVNPKLATQYVQAAQALKAKEADISLKQAQATKALREPSQRDYEYEKMMDILANPDLTEEQHRQAQERIDALNAKAKGAAGGTGRAIKFDAAGGTYWLDPYTKSVTTIGGRTLSPEEADKLITASNDPTLQAAIATAKAGSKAKGEDMAKAQAALPEATNTYNQTVDLLGQIEQNPAFSSLVGWSWTPGARKIPGSKEAGLQSMLEQLSSLAEMHQREKLKGTGQITDYESNMARGAIFRASAAQSEADYRKAMQDFKHWMGKSMEALHQRADTPFRNPLPIAPTQPSLPQQSSQSVLKPSQPFSGVTTPNQVRDLYRQGKLTKDAANKILDDMKTRGVF